MRHSPRVAEADLAGGLHDALLGRQGLVGRVVLEAEAPLPHVEELHHDLEGPLVEVAERVVDVEAEPADRSLLVLLRAERLEAAEADLLEEPVLGRQRFQPLLVGVVRDRPRPRASPPCTSPSAGRTSRSP
jgi:hypothetical protein